MSSITTDTISQIKNLEKTIREKAGIPIVPNSQPNNSDFGTGFSGLPFWLWDLPSAEHTQKAIDTKRNCCFNHRIGLPFREGKHSAIFPWQRTIFDAYEEHKHTWILKATGLGLTEFTLRYILWKCTNSNEWRYGRICIVTGPNIDLALQLIERSKNMIQEAYPIVDATTKSFVINEVAIKAYPSNHLDAMRSLVNVKFIFLDEADFFPPGEQQDARDTSERYIAKSDPHIVMVSTPNAPGGLMEKIENEKESLYYRIKLPYTVGVGTMYTQEQIDKNMQSPSFEREYNLKYRGLIGNVFNIMDIQYAVNVLGVQYDPYDQTVTTDYTITRAMGVDPGFGSSQFAIVIQEWVNGMSEIILAEEIDRGSMTECLNEVLRLVQKHRIVKVFVDGSAAGFIADLKKAYGEPRNYAEVIKNNPKIVDQWIRSDTNEGGIKVVPISFRDRHEVMLRNVETIIQKKLLRIHPSFSKLIIALRTATSHGDKYDLDKVRTSHNDILDALQLSLLNLYLT